MASKTLIVRAALNAFVTALYVALVALLITNAQALFGTPAPFVGPLAFLLLFVVSATITGSLVLGKPALLFLSGDKQAAIRLFLYTLLFLVVITLIVLAILASLPHSPPVTR